MYLERSGVRKKAFLALLGSLPVDWNNFIADEVKQFLSVILLVGVDEGIICPEEAAEKQAPKEIEILLVFLRLLRGIDTRVNALLATSSSCCGN